MFNLSARSYHTLLKQNISLWQLYCASTETVFHRMMMMTHQPSDHPEFQRMVNEKVTASLRGWADMVSEYQTLYWKMLMQGKQPNINRAIADNAKLYNALMGNASRTASANALRLRKQK